MIGIQDGYNKNFHIKCTENYEKFDSLHYKKGTSVTFWAEHIFFCHTYDTSMTIIVTKPGIIIDVVGSTFYDKKT